MDENFPEVSLETVKSRAVKGVLALTGRTLILNVVALIAQGFLWAFLTPEQFGTFWIVSAVVNFLVYFSDIGLAAALIQKKEHPDASDLKTTFTVQQILVLALLLILFLASPLLSKLQGLTHEGRILLYALGFSFFLSSLKSIPSVLLERKLEFGKFILPQVIENLVYSVTVVFFAWRGYGIMSFTYAVLARGIVGLVAVYILQPWMPGIKISKKSLKGLLSFGVPYQVNSLIAVVKDDGMTILLGSILGPAGVGILGTAQRLAQYPLRFFMDNVTKVTFPAFSRMQDDKKSLERAVTRSIFFITFLVFPSIIGLVVLSPLLVKVIPKYGKWAPALIPLALLSVNTVFAAVTTQLTNTLNAVGKIKKTFFLMVMWAILTFALVPLLANKYGPTGAALGYSLVGLSSVVAIYITKRIINFSLWEGCFKVLASASLMGLILFVLRNRFSASFYSFLGLVGVGALVYLSGIFILYGKGVIEDVKKGTKAVFTR